jgi:TRAP-type C4-dicarboxylate transport system substrate-binding protein
MRQPGVNGGVALAVLTVAAVGCSGGTKAGGKVAERTTVLSMASQIGGGPPQQLVQFASEVAKRSGGTIRIDFENNWRERDRHQELDTIRDVRADKVDLAWVGARAWDSVGVTDFDPLVAPLLIDSYPLEEQVFARRLPQRMLAGVRRAGVIGIGVLPGPMRKLLGVRHAFVRPADFRGQTIGAMGMLAAEAFRTLGARPHQQFAQERLGALDAVESQMSAIVGNGYDTHARFLSANLSLWPRPLVIFASPRVFRSLTREQQDALREGAAAAVPAALVASEQEDALAVRILCARRKVALVDLAQPQRAALLGAVAPVYRRLESNAGTRRAIHEIEALKRAAPPAPAVHCAARSASGAAASTPIDGSWVMTTTVSGLKRNPAYRAYGYNDPTEDDFRADAGTSRLVLHNGKLQWSATNVGGSSADTGTYRIDGDRVVFHITGGHDIGEIWTYRWSVYRDTLTFRRPPTGHQGPPNPTFASWHRAGR